MRTKLFSTSSNFYLRGRRQKRFLGRELRRTGQKCEKDGVQKVREAHASKEVTVTVASGFTS